MINSFWKDKKVLITGHTGFVGTWLTMYLQQFGADLYGIALEPEQNSLYQRVERNLTVHSTLLDLREKESICEAIRSIRPEVVIHLAAFGFVQECFQDPERAFTTNINGTLNLLQAVERCDSVKCLVIASSDKVYQNTGIHRLFEEDDALGGMDPYSASKTCQDLTVRSFYDSYLKKKEIGMCVVRPSNVLGGFDHHNNRLIPSIFLAYQDGRCPEIRHPNAVRPWQDILDMCDAYRFLAERAYSQMDCEVFNVGPEVDGVCTVKEIDKYVAYLYGVVRTIEKGYEKEESCKSFPPEQEWLGLSIQKIKSIGWSPKVTIYDILSHVHECYKHPQYNEAFQICMRQIGNYIDVSMDLK